MQVIDNTKNKRPMTNEEFSLTVEFHNGQRYIYYGKNKKDAEMSFKKKFGNYKGFVKKEWSIVEE